MRKYVAGFLFKRSWDGQLADVLLVEKLKPEWQAGLWNGIGGKIKNNEPLLVAMHREFEEETGLKGLNWQHVVTLTDKRGWEVFFFRATISALDKDLHEMLDVNDIGERLAWHSPFQLPEKIIHNLKWLVPFCLWQDVAYPVEIIEPTYDEEAK